MSFVFGGKVSLTLSDLGSTRRNDSEHAKCGGVLLRDSVLIHYTHGMVGYLLTLARFAHAGTAHLPTEYRVQIFATYEPHRGLQNCKTDF